MRARAAPPLAALGARAARRSPRAAVARRRGTDPPRIRRPAREDLQARLRSDPARRPRHPRRRPLRTPPPRRDARFAKAKRIFAGTVSSISTRAAARGRQGHPRPLVRRPGARDRGTSGAPPPPCAPKTSPASSASRADFIHEGNKANNVVVSFGFNYCAFKPSRFTMSRRAPPKARRRSRSSSCSPLAYLAVGPAGAEQSGRPGVVVSLDGSISPRHIPRHRPVPVSLTLAGSVRGTDGAPPPQLRRIEIAFGARGGLDTAGLPRLPPRPPAQRHRSARRSPAAAARWSAAARSRTEVPLDPDEPAARPRRRPRLQRPLRRAPGRLGPRLLGLAAGLLRPALLPAPPAHAAPTGS